MIEVDLAKKAGLKITNVPAYSPRSVAEMALMQTNLGSKSDNTADNTRQVAEELAGKEGHK